MGAATFKVNLSFGKLPVEADCDKPPAIALFVVAVLAVLLSVASPLTGSLCTD